MRLNEGVVGGHRQPELQGPRRTWPHNVDLNLAACCRPDPSLLDNK
jgi:hypothetical protein